MESLPEKSFGLLFGKRNTVVTYHIITVILAVDYGLTIVFHKNLLSIELQEITLGITAAFIVSYLLFTILSSVCVGLLEFLVIKKRGLSSSKNIRYKSFSKLKHEALTEQSEFKLKVLNLHVEEQRKLAKYRRNFLLTAFELFFVLILEFFYTSSTPLVQIVFNKLPKELTWAFLIVLLILIVAWINCLLENNYDKHMIEWPVDDPSKPDLGIANL